MSTNDDKTPHRVLVPPNDNETPIIKDAVIVVNKTRLAVDESFDKNKRRRRRRTATSNNNNVVKKKKKNTFDIPKCGVDSDKTNITSQENKTNVSGGSGVDQADDCHHSSISFPTQNLSFEFDLATNQYQKKVLKKKNRSLKKEPRCNKDNDDNHHDQSSTTRTAADEDEDNSSTSSASCSVSSITTNRDHGVWDGNDTPWKGCICGTTHPKPTNVFWIQCDGPCQSWYNVAVDCVGFDTQYATTSISTWMCRTQLCTNKLQNKNNPILQYILNLPDVLMYHILMYCAPPTDRVIVLCTQIAPLCTATQHSIHHDPSWSGLWSLIFQQEYNNNHSNSCSSSNNNPNNCNRTISEQQQKQQQYSQQIANRRWSSRKRHQRRRPTSVNDAKDQVMEAHLSLCVQTDDAHMALATAAESQYSPLCLKRLRCILLGDRTTAATRCSSSPAYYNTTSSYFTPIRINRPSPFAGRTFLHVCCAADYVDERVVLRCVKELVQRYGADPNIFTTAESPYADRPVLFFAISRIMPTVVKFLIEPGQHNSKSNGNNTGRTCSGTFVQQKVDTSVIVSGTFRYISDPSKTFTGSFTPLGFAQKLWDVEQQQQQQSSKTSSSSKSHNHLDQYWSSKLSTCIQILLKEQKT